MSNERVSKEPPPKAGGRSLEEFQTIEEDYAIDGLYPAEHGLMVACREGRDYICQSLDLESPERPSHPINDQNFIRGEFLRFLVLSGDDIGIFTPSGLSVLGAWISCDEKDDRPTLNLEGCQFSHDLILGFCKIDGLVVFRGASLKSIIFDSSEVDGIDGDSVRILDIAHLCQGFRSIGPVRLVGAQIGTNLAFLGSEILSAPISLLCDRIAVGGSVYLQNNFRAHGTVRFLGADIGGDFNCRAGHFMAPEVSLNCDSMKAKGYVFLRDGFVAYGKVNFINARIAGTIECNCGQFLGDMTAFGLQGCRVEGSGYFFSSENSETLVNGTLDFYNASFGASLLFDGMVSSTRNQAIIATGLKVGSELRFLNSHFNGPISITNAEIGGDVTFNGAKLLRGFAIERSKIGGILYWRQLDKFFHTLSLRHSEVKAFSFDKKSWQKPERIHLQGFRYERFADLPPNCDGAYWVKTFLGGWRNGKDYEVPRKGMFRPTIHGQLADVLNHMGHEEEARAVNIEKRRLTLREERKRLTHESGALQWLTSFWNAITGFTIDYGYRPGKAALWMFGILLIGWGLYFSAGQKGVMTPTHPLIFNQAYGGSIPDYCQDRWTSAQCTKAMPSEYSEFSSFIYSADVLLPIINFRQQDDWAPRVVDRNGNRDWFGWWVRTFEWAQTGLGWLLSLLLVSGVTGIIRRD